MDDLEIEKRRAEINTELLIEQLFNCDPSSKKDIKLIEDEFKCSIVCNIEKINSLQYNYYYSVDFNIGDSFEVAIESGINRGTVLIDANWDCNLTPQSRTQSVVVGVKLNDSYYEEGSLKRKIAQIILDANKDVFMDWHTKNGYDNYVTGGNSTLRLPESLRKLHVEFVYNEVECDINFI